MSDRDTFGPRLRSERERRGISIETIVTVTKVGADLWLGLEHNDFSKWPSGIFARAFVRDYAKAVGLDADEVVDEFCRLFPHGDRRAARIIKAQARTDRTLGRLRLTSPRWFRVEEIAAPRHATRKRSPTGGVFASRLGRSRPRSTSVAPSLSRSWGLQSSAPDSGPRPASLPSSITASRPF